jgi:phage FluMu protein Com
MDDKVKIRCPACKQVFREKAARVRDGFQVNCQSCNKLLTLSKETEDPFIRRALKTAREIRAAQEAALFAATYTGVASTPKRETPQA